MSSYILKETRIFITFAYFEMYLVYLFLEPLTIFIHLRDLQLITVSWAVNPGSPEAL